MRVQTYMCPLVAALLAVVLTYVGSVEIGVVSVSSGVSCDTVSRQFSKYETYHFWYGSVTTAPYEVYLDLTLYPQHTRFPYIKDITYRSVVSIPNNEEIACAHKSNIYSEHLTGHSVT